MNDPIKKFVEQHREAFDHMEPPANVLDQIKNRLKAQAGEEKKANEKKTEEIKIVPLFSRAKWAIAASILLTITTTYFFYNGKTNTSDVDVIAQQSTPKAAHKTTVESSTNQQKKHDNASQAVNTNGEVAVNQEIAAKPTGIIKSRSAAKAIKNPVDKQTKDLYARLGDSSSSSIRLSAILDIEKTNSINKNTINNLAKTLNHDSNSNVRLAALEVMGQYVNNKHVSSLLVSSFSTQNDPLVQLGMIGLLGKIDNVKVEDRLFALADDPNTFGAVKDEAYLALLNQNKL